MGTTDYGINNKPTKGDIHSIIQQQLFDYMHENNISQQVLAERLGESTSNLSRWMNSETSAPPVYKLQTVAALLGTTVDGLLTGKKVAIDRDLTSTYSKAFLAIIELSDKWLISPDSRDPFLDWLLKTKLEIDQMPMVSAEKRQAWMDKVLSDFNKPILSVYLTQYIELFKFVYREINEYDTYLCVFNLLQGYADGSKKDEIDALIKRWHNYLANETNEFPALDIPYGGIMYDIDENGNLRVVEKPRYVEGQWDESLDPDAEP